MELFAQIVIDCIRFDSGLSFEELQDPWFEEFFECLRFRGRPFVPISVMRKCPSEEISDKVILAIAKLYETGSPVIKQFIIECSGYEKGIDREYLELCLFTQAFSRRNEVM